MRSSRISLVALAAVCAALLCAGAASTQTAKKPISKQGLVNAVKINGLSTQELVAQIQRRGVDFELTAADESDLQSVGARPEIIEAARSNYRPAAVATARPTPANVPPRTNTSGPAANIPAGPPLSKSEIVAMLQAGAPPARVEQFVEKRGVSFQVTPEIAHEITAAGGNRSLVGAITEKSTAETASNNNGGGDSPFGSTSNTAANNAPDYDDLIDRASSAVASQDFNGAMRFAQQAAQLDPQQPTAHSILGTIALYYSQNISTAEQEMRAAIERGGAAAFHVYHDHNGGFTDYCEGSFFVTKTGVSFKANDGRDTFEAVDSNIKEAKVNGFVGSEYGAFHIKPVQKINGRDNFNFAPNTRSKAEAQLIVRLISGY
ncbi:MAG: hypothetical protein ACJ74T_19100 [Pyrinomonadaceae bacterium]